MTSVSRRTFLWTGSAVTLAAVTRSPEPLAVAILGWGSRATTYCEAAQAGLIRIQAVAEKRPDRLAAASAELVKAQRHRPKTSSAPGILFDPDSPALILCTARPEGLEPLFRRALSLRRPVFLDAKEALAPCSPFGAGKHKALHETVLIAPLAASWPSLDTDNLFATAFQCGARSVTAEVHYPSGESGGIEPIHYELASSALRAAESAGPNLFNHRQIALFAKPSLDWRVELVIEGPGVSFTHSAKLASDVQTYPATHAVFRIKEYAGRSPESRAKLASLQWGALAATRSANILGPLR